MQPLNGPRIIVAMDFDNADDCLQLARRLSPHQCRLKVGKELFTHCGPALINELQVLGFDVFLDLKFHDIPNTTARAVRAAAELGVWMVNLHISGGPRMIHAARQVLDAYDKPPLLTGVTVLTSMEEAELAEIGVRGSVQHHVQRLAQLGREAGLDGVVCSAREATRLRQLCGPDFALVTPGIRPLGSAQGDQKRTMTPAEALQAGSDYLVIGRPITLAEDPAGVCRAIIDSLEERT